MTDNEIVKALECCYDLDSSAICHQCPLYQTENCRDGYLGLQALNLINRQKAEIERLQAEVTAINNDYDNLMVEKDELFDIAEVEFEEIKAEAYKEFAERVKEEIVQALESNYKAQNERLLKTNKVDEFVKYCDGKIITLRGLKDFLDDLLKELVGEDNEVTN